MVMRIESMESFRQTYREGIAPRYNGWLHMLTVSAIAIVVISFALAQLHQVQWVEWLVFPFTMLLVNFAEYYAHRWLGHTKTRVGKLFYQRHTGDHHSFFLQGHMSYQSTRDWRVVLFPAFLIVAFIFGLILPPGFLLMEYLSANTAYLYGAAALSGYLFYEVMHFSYHVPDGSWEERLFLWIPGWKAMRQTHRLHHNRDRMRERNFNITLPIFDVLLGTLYWEPMGDSPASTD